MKLHLHLFWATGCLALTVVTSMGVFAADFPIKGKPIRIIVGLPAGGPSDTQARAFALEMQNDLGVPVVVENKPGASMVIANMEVAKALPDGHTLLYTPSSAMAQVPHTMDKVGFDPFKDFTPISKTGVGPLVFVIQKKLPANNVKELVAYAKANPGVLNYASFGMGTSSHLYGLMLNKQNGLNMVHVPYKGSTDVAKDFIGGQVHMQFASAPSAVILADGGHGKIIGVAAAQRSPFLPNVPTMEEQGVMGFDMESWTGFFGPAGMKPEVTARINATIARALATPKIKETFVHGAMEPRASSAEEFALALRTTYDQWGKFIANVAYRKE